MNNAGKLPSNFMLYTDNRLSTVTFSQDDIGKIIQNLNPNKAHGHDNISIRMLKICGSSIYGPLELIFKEALSTGSFPSNWKKRNIVPTHEKGDREILKNYRPVSLFNFNFFSLFHYSISANMWENLWKTNFQGTVFNFCWKITLFHQISLGSNLRILALINYYLQHRKFTIHLMRNWKWEASFLTFLKPLIKCDKKVLFLNCRKIVYLVTS